MSTLFKIGPSVKVGELNKSVQDAINAQRAARLRDDFVKVKIGLAVGATAAVVGAISSLSSASPGESFLAAAQVSAMILPASYAAMLAAGATHIGEFYSSTLLRVADRAKSLLTGCRLEDEAAHRYEETIKIALGSSVLFERPPQNPLVLDVEPLRGSLPKVNNKYNLQDFHLSDRPGIYESPAEPKSQRPRIR